MEAFIMVHLPLLQTSIMPIETVSERKRRWSCAQGFSMIEMLAVVSIIAIVISATVGVAGSLRASRGMTGVHQLAAACDAARARAMKEQREVMLAFSTQTMGEGYEGRAVLICSAPLPSPNDGELTAESEIQRQRESILEPLSEWIYLPDGHVFAAVAPASRAAGVNILTLMGTTRRVRLPGDSGVASLTCIGFGSMGEVVFPEATPTNGAPLLIAIAETANPDSVNPQECRWIGIQTHSGASMILP
jgi:prepilin-type N-terminal cleavage/methylation domain-containing protein